MTAVPGSSSLTLVFDRGVCEMSPHDTPTTAKEHLTLALTNHDIAFAIMQGAIGLRAPMGTKPEDALREAAASEPEMVAGFYRAARNVMRLLETEINRVRH
jgi:L-asparaginase II